MPIPSPRSASVVPIDEVDRSDEGRGRTAVITGASSGIGLAMTQLLAAKGYAVLPLARREDRLASLSEHVRERWGVAAEPIVADLSESATPARVIADLTNRGQRVDVLVNNAGFSKLGRYDTISWPEHEERVRVLGLATLELTHRALPHMVERRWGRIINVASIAGLFSGTPQDVLYSATKSMVIKFSEGIDAEFHSLGIHCVASLPGFTDTEIFEASGFADEVAANPLYRRALMPPETVAREAYAAVMAGRSFVTHGAHHKVLGLALTHMPRALRLRLSHRLSRLEPDVS
jgi:short-subunit dehydrogenase